MSWTARGAAAAGAAAAASLLIACGARTDLSPEVDASAPDVPEPTPEICNGLDDDLDGAFDEAYRDEEGRYVDDAHCGGCGMPCEPPTDPRAVAASCALIEQTPTCVATACEEGWAPSSTGRCVPLFDRLCLPCIDDADCGDLDIARCTDVGGEQVCSVGCDFGCPEGYTCDGEGEEAVCVPEGGSCACSPGESFTVACAIETGVDDEGEVERCVGSATCEDGTLSMCAGSEEVCDEVDNDCDGEVDEGFVDERGAYILDIHHCGECGIDCTADMIPGADLQCGGDPFAPTCVLACPDAEDGIDPGDEIDADRDIATGCECTVGSLDDVPGPVGASGENLDVNCDGADGIVVDSFYVAPDGDDDGPGSPTRPMKTVQAAIDAAADSLDTGSPRPHVFVASGSYTETVQLREGVRIHGGYRRDFLALDPTGFRVEIRAPSDTEGAGGAALLAEGIGHERQTSMEWLSVRGVDATEPSSPAFGAVLVDPGPQLSLRDMELRSGVAGAGMSGTDGEAGASPDRQGEPGDVPRAAREDATHACLRDGTNEVDGGVGGRNTCDGVDVSGGAGGSPGCPSFSEFQPPGERGNDAGPVRGGAGGAGGQDSRGPIPGSRSGCDEEPVCCGLADFTVPSEFRGPQPGAAGGDGGAGTAGRSCMDPFGRFEDLRWIAAGATEGTAGTAGSGGGGGGAGGGAEIEWFDGACEFADGLGGGGGGGGGGGCGGEAGEPGSSGGPAVALLVLYRRSVMGAPSLSGLDIAPGDGGRGGNGGAGGDGGLGGAGGFGGELARELQSTPSLAGPFPGARGGPGGNGGPGGGGGAGCGGPSVGIWVTGDGAGAPVDTWRADNDFALGRPGTPGRGGGGGAPAPDGAAGGAMEVVVR